MRLRQGWLALASGLLFSGCGDTSPSPAPALDVSRAELAFELDVEGRPVRIEVARHTRVAPALRTFAEQDGSFVERPTDSSLNRCQYQGTAVRLDIANARSSAAAISTCSGLAGSFSLDEILFELAPGTTPSDARVFRAGRRSSAAQQVALRPVPAAAVARSAQALTVPTRFLEVVVVADADYGALYGAGAQSRAVQLANYADALYRDPSLTHSIGIELVGYVSLSSSPFAWSTTAAGEASASSLLDGFTTWYHGEGQLPRTDDPVLLSGLDLDGATVGLAGVGTAADPVRAGAVVEASFTSASYSAVTLAHELGHTLGMQHDGENNGCASRGEIMAAIADQPEPATRWSTCSDEALSQWLATARYASELDNLPTGNAVRCGDGLKQGDEACDCGDSDCSLSDPCCDGATCQLAPGAACSARDGCCDAACQIVRDARVCHTGDGCQAAAVCDSISSVCPANSPIANGSPCDDGSGDASRGRCLQGACAPSDLRQCQDVVAQGYALPGVTTCSRLSALNGGNPCQVLYCGMNDDSSRCASLLDYAGARLRVSDGMDCGSGAQCYQGTCLPSASLPKCPTGTLENACGGCGPLSTSPGAACFSGEAQGITRCNATGQLRCDTSPSYAWIEGGFGDCSQDCGSGQQTQWVACQDAVTGRDVDPALCPGEAPPVMRSCQALLCDGDPCNAASDCKSGVCARSGWSWQSRCLPPG